MGTLNNQPKMGIPIVVGIDATNIGGGGGITHLKEVLNSFDQEFFKDKIASIVVFASKNTLNRLPELEVLQKKTFKNLNGNLLKRVFFQIRHFDTHIKESGVDVLFSVTGDYIGNFAPVVAMSRNMLLYERKIWKDINSIKEIVRFWLNYKKQRRCFKNASGVIFISNHAKTVICADLNLKEKNIVTIHHGLSLKFLKEPRAQKEISEYSFEKPFRMLYVSTVHVYKHQWNVVRAINVLRHKGLPVCLDLIGGVIFEPAGKRLKSTIQQVDPEGNFIQYHGHVDYDMIQNIYSMADGIVFASTCENMPNILLESMASGLPIACSSTLPMPEFLKNNGFYFDPHNVDSTVNAIECMLVNKSQREKMIKENIEEAKKYSWNKTSKDTFLNLIENYNHI
ncbi:glycosyltransferase [Flagellimonas nanhaiensis]|uniref:Glycosyltransferase n=1 Tax=Flagellimonas nanhaiensis TaxID=2292706 RepID=A0A371JQP3_9FLAO|nr:glycosyltransferase [Allomuricauda nanhaiensis]RDY59830.1 glycosyltransferase [Allomuricauda nanhaiensis]